MVRTKRHVRAAVEPLELMAKEDVRAYDEAYARRVVRGDLDQMWQRTGR